MLAFVSLWSKNLISQWTRVRKQEVFFRQFHALVRAAVPLPTAFVQLRAYAPDEAFAQGLSQVAKLVASGKTLGEALRSQPALFEADQLELLSAAEQSGSLDVVLSALAKHLEEVRRLRWKAFTASIWPAYLLGLVIFLAPLVRVGSSGVKSMGDVGGAYVAGLLPGLMVAIVGVLVVVLTPVVVAALKAQPGSKQVKSIVVYVLVGDSFATLSDGVLSVGGHAVMDGLGSFLHQDQVERALGAKR